MNLFRRAFHAVNKPSSSVEVSPVEASPVEASPVEASGPQQPASTITEDADVRPTQEPVARTTETAATPETQATPVPAERQHRIFSTDDIQLHGSARDKHDAIREAGQILVDRGAVDTSYVEAMFEREKSVSTYMGNGLAIPHGTNEAKQLINDSAMSFVRLDQPVDWNGNPVRFVIAIAGRNKEHLTILGKIARIFSNRDSVDALDAAQSEEDVYEVLSRVNG